MKDKGSEIRNFGWDFGIFSGSVEAWKHGSMGAGEAWKDGSVEAGKHGSMEATTEELSYTFYHPIGAVLILIFIF